ncbi:MAG: TIGR02757 family protein [Desulfobacterales bacterium]
MTPKNIKRRLDNLYLRYNQHKYIHPDPIEFLYLYSDIRDREIAGLIASSLAYGRVKQILKSVSYVLNIMAPSPYLFLKNSTHASLQNAFKSFTHRFANGDHLAGLLQNVKNVVAQYGSLNECFIRGVSTDDTTLIPALNCFATALTNGNSNPGHLIALPEKGSACKRMNLFLRWMVRKDDIDPGGWNGVPMSKLIIPLDTHMHKISLKWDLTSRQQANMRTALEITSGFRQIVPDDPVKYDFVLTRFGIRDDMHIDDL